MIIDQMANASFYCNVHPGLAKVIEFLQTLDPNMKAGRYEIDGDDIFATVQEPAQTQYEHAKLEAHRKYIDIHVVLKGHEYIGIAPLNDQIEEEYDEGKDILFYNDNGSKSIYLDEGYFCLIWPHEGHKPNCYFETPCASRKIVIKLRVNN